MTAKRYPICIKCKEEMSPQDSRGWEKIETYQTDGGKGIEFWLCQSCIINFQAVDDLRKGNQDLRDGLLDKPSISYWKNKAEQINNASFIDKLKYLFRL